MRCISLEQIELYRVYLISEERAALTVEKYIRDVTAFCRWVREKDVNKERVVQYKARLIETYAPSSVNSILSSLMSFFTFLGWNDLKVKSLKIQRKIFDSEEKELTKAEYQRLLRAAKAKQNERLYLLLQTVCSTGIRVSELKHITVEAVMTGKAEISCKGKQRAVFLPDKLCKMLKRYIRERKITSGPVFVT